MKLCYITDQLSDDFELACRLMSEHGYDSIELNTYQGKTITELNQADMDAIKRICGRYGLRIVMAASTLFLLCKLRETDIISDFNPQFLKIHGDLKQHLAMVEKAVFVADYLGCPQIRAFPFRAPDNRALVGDTTDVQAISAVFMQAVKIAAAAGVTIALENCPYSCLPRGIMTQKVIEAVGDRHLRLLYDVGNSYRADKERIPESYRTLPLVTEVDLIVSAIGHVHIKDYHYDATADKPYGHVPIGQGDIPLTQITAHLAAGGYPGFISGEPDVASAAAIRGLTSLRNLI